MANSARYQQDPSFLHVNIIFMLSLLMILLGGASLFIFRHPLVIVSDDAFETLYGVRRASNARISLSIELLRPVRLAMVAPSASAEATADAADLAGGGTRPVGVLFPDRYLAGARIYSGRYPERSVFVIGDRSDKAIQGRPADTKVVAGNDAPALIFFGPDRYNDLYRAGMIAGFVSRQGRPAVRLGSSFGTSLEESRSAFSAGLAVSGSGADPLFLRPGDPLPLSAENISILIDAFPSMGFPSTAWISIPRLVFSWMDPELVDPAVLLLIDDSPYALAAAALLRGAGKKNGDFSPSLFMPTLSGYSLPGLVEALRKMDKSVIP